jgi:hypothetical protein
MTSFEFAFSLFGLVLGLALAEVLGGFVRVLKARTASASSNVAIRIGWQTPLLGLLVTLDLISFWLGAWEDREIVPIDFAPLVFVCAVAGIYYAAASLIFPDDPERWPNLDDWFERHKSQVAAGILIANLCFSLGEVMLTGTYSNSVPGRVSQLIYLSLAGALIVTKRKAHSLVVIGLMLLVFAVLAARPALIAAFGP